MINLRKKLKQQEDSGAPFIQLKRKDVEHILETIECLTQSLHDYLVYMENPTMRRNAIKAVVQVRPDLKGAL